MMITPGFFSFFNTHRALVAAQNALSTVNQNVSNVNTPGYSRQRVELKAHDAYHSPNLTQQMGGQIGQGVIVDSVKRIHDNFLDAQFRSQNGLLGMNQMTRDILQQIQSVIVEPSDSGISSAIQNFFDAAQELSIHPESLAVRSDFIQQSSDLLTIFQQQTAQLSTLRQNMVGDPSIPGSITNSQMAIAVDQVNDYLQSITQINKQIITITASGAQPNDLLDQRDQLLDELSQLIDINVTHLDNNMVNVSIGDDLSSPGSGIQVIRGAQLIDTLEVVPNTGPPPIGTPEEYDVPAFIQTVNGGVVLNDYTGFEISSGKIKGLINGGQNDATDPTQVNVRTILTDLDTLFTQLATQINALQTTGRDLNGNVNGLELYVTPPAVPPGTDPIQISNWAINPLFLDPLTGPHLVAAAEDDPLASGPPAGWAGTGDGRNALSMAQLKDAGIAGLGNTTFTEYFNGAVSSLGIRTRTFENQSNSQGQVIQSLETQRQSVQGVNIDEEMIDMIRYQRAFEASSKAMGVLDEIIQTIINMT
ncbi:MAG: flagellar hook-associated protein FlgK [Candidatus Melainabacteria bacterium]